ncbi:hypothetical protein Csa_011610 [Cucumis sativus]|uniref:Uncharacterized protein n=1 Tax=Cucumis sativus TaxID=3659 RepID=A0A0A0LAQ1_CUCSA|nr:hypothetical protein Csa_011610 [Cucumis sativus]
MDGDDKIDDGEDDRRGTLIVRKKMEVKVRPRRRIWTSIARTEVRETTKADD